MKSNFTEPKKYTDDIKLYASLRSHADAKKLKKVIQVTSDFKVRIIENVQTSKFDVFYYKPIKK